MKTHWGGGLDFDGLTAATGFPCCVTDRAAWKVRNTGNYTMIRSNVDCKNCLRLLSRQDAWLQKEREKQIHEANSSAYHGDIDGDFDY